MCLYRLLKASGRYTSVTISDETAAKLTKIVVDQDLGSIVEAIDYVVDTTREPKALSEAELARLLYRKLAD